MDDDDDDDEEEEEEEEDNEDGRTALARDVHKTSNKFVQCTSQS